jgi:hypothetical protein
VNSVPEKQLNQIYIYNFHCVKETAWSSYTTPTKSSEKYKGGIDKSDKPLGKYGT